MHPDLKLYLVEFGKPDGIGFITFGSGKEPVWVLAKDYNEAAEKALFYTANVKGVKSIISGDGSLINSSEDFSIKNIRLITEELVY